MLLNPDSDSHITVNRWFSAMDVRELISSVREIAHRFEAEFEVMRMHSVPWGVDQRIDPKQRSLVAIASVLELIFGTLDPALAQAPIGTRFKARLSEVSEQLGVPASVLRAREASEVDLKRWFDAAIASEVRSTH